MYIKGRDNVHSSPYAILKWDIYPQGHSALGKYATKKACLCLAVHKTASHY